LRGNNIMTHAPLKPKTFAGDLGALPEALAPLIKLPRWVVWRWEWKKGNWTKPPYQTRDPKRNAKNNDPSTWGTYEEALAQVENGKADGIGFNLLDGDYGAEDLDKCRDPETETIAEWAQQHVARAPADAYAEVTVSGTGLRIIGTVISAKNIHGQFKNVGYELYGAVARYITISGLALDGRGGKPLPNIDQFLEELTNEKKKTKRKPGQRENVRESATDLPPLLKSLLTTVGSGGYPSRSELLFAFVGGAMRAGINDDTIIEACLDSALEGHGYGIFDHCQENSGERCVKRAIENVANMTEPTGGKQVIHVKGGDRHEAWRATQRAMIAAKCQVFVRGGALVEPLWRWEEIKDDKDKDKGHGVLTMKFVKYNLARLSDQVARHAAEFWKYNAKARKELQIDPPNDIIETLLTRGDWDFESARGLINTPTLRRDGSLLDVPGYDRATGLWYMPPLNFNMPTIAERPTRDDALEALNLFNGLLDEFPFVDDVARSVALAGLMTPVLRGAFKVAPLFFIPKPTAGTGASYLVELISCLATGRPAAPLKVSKDPKEMPKELSAAAFEAKPILNLNNITFDLESSDLAQMVTEGTLDIRPFGKNDELRSCDCRAMTITPTATTWSSSASWSAVYLPVASTRRWSAPNSEPSGTSLSRRCLPSAANIWPQYSPSPALSRLPANQGWMRPRQ
jgi:hypothetical protein